MFTGSFVAIVTPMNTDGTIDYHCLEDLIEWHIDQGTDGIVVCGTTGESPTLTSIENASLIETTVSCVHSRVPVIAGTGTNSTQRSIEQTLQAEQLGANGALIITPYYNKPTQEGLIKHFSAIAENTKLPIILYNNPGRTVCDLTPESIGTLSKIKSIVGVKEASSRIDLVIDIIKRCGPEFTVLSGDDGATVDMMKVGGHGTISVTANIAPQQMAAMCKAGLEKDFDTAKTINQTLMPLHENLFIESNPIPVKWALQQMGKIPGGIRLPLTALSENNQNSVMNALGTVSAVSR